MANKIQFKRGLKTNLPSSADVGMPLWCTDTQELYIGTGTGVSKVGGSESSSSEQSESQTVVINSDVPVVTDPTSVLQDDPNYQLYYNNYRYGNELMLKDNTAYNFHIDDYISFQLPEIDDGNVVTFVLYLNKSCGTDLISQLQNVLLNDVTSVLYLNKSGGIICSFLQLRNISLIEVTRGKYLNKSS